MSTIEIILTFNRTDFEELFFKNNNEKLFFAPARKELSIITLVFGCLFAASLIYSLVTNSGWTIFILVFIIFLITAIELYGKLTVIIKWKKAVNNYLDELAGYKSHKIILSEGAFSLIQDSTETIERWLAFKKVVINDESIILSGSESFYFPKKSMSVEDYEVLKKEVKSKMSDLVISE